jgi:hypothetical protein
MKYANALKVIAVNFAFLLCYTPLAQAEESAATDSFWDGFYLGGYTSAGITAHHHGETEAALNEISLIVGWNNNGRVSFFSELELEKPLYWNDEKQFTHEGSYFDLERAYFDFNLSDQANIRAGRFLTPAGRWNLLHAAPLVWTSSRPLATSRLFPSATNGVMLFGAVPLTQVGLEYSLFAETLKDQHQDGDEILFKNTYGARIDLTGNIKTGLVLMHFQERTAGNPEFNMVGLDFLTQVQGWELSGEGFQRFYTDGKNGGSGAYLQAVAPLGNRWHAVGRLETYQHPNEGTDEKWLLGLAWKRTDKQILKLEMVGGDTEHNESPKGFLASFAVLF